jgi:hypothetical protein
MRWFKPYHGNRKIKTWFAFLPVTIDGETRWMEKVTVLYFYNEYIEVWNRHCFLDTITEDQSK